MSAAVFSLNLLKECKTPPTREKHTRDVDLVIINLSNRLLSVSLAFLTEGVNWIRSWVREYQYLNSGVT